MSSHPEYVRRNLNNDFALLFTDEDFELDSHLDTICLPNYKEKFEHNERCWATGWGKDQFGDEGRYQVVLKAVDLPMWEHNRCQQALRAHERLPPK